MNLRWAVVCLMALVLLPRSARGFSDPERFAESSGSGGGGGRWFTGSPVDGYTCSVCHTDGETDGAAFSGLPAAGYVPGETYELGVDWPQDGVSRALLLDAVDHTGATAGSFAPVAEASMLPLQRCGMQAGGEPAAYLKAAGPRRTVVGLTDCGAGQLRVLWTAPMQAEGPVVFAASVVRSNKDGNFTGDGVAELAREVYPVGQLPSSENGGCSSASPTAGLRWPLALAWVWWFRRRQHRR